MSLQGLFTNEGLAKSVEAENNQGFRIKPTSFAVSEEFGDLISSRDLSSVKPTWYSGLISSVVKIDDNTIQINCNIPANVDTSPRYTREVYLFANDFSTGDEYLLAFCQPTAELTYDPEGELKIRLQLKIANIDLASLYEFHYTQATELGDHNNDHNAHPALQTIFNKAGIYSSSATNKYNGQQYDGFPAKAPAVQNRDAVYFDTINNRYDLAIAIDGDPRRYAIGFYDSANDVVVYGGIIEYPHTLLPYTAIYLSDTIAGASGTSPTGVLLGYSLPNNKIFVGADLSSATQSQDFDGDVTVNLRPPNIRELTLVDDNGVKWDVKIGDDGLLYTVPDSIREPDALFRIPKIDLSSAQLKVKVDGELIVVSPPSNPSSMSDEYYYLESPSGISWKLTVNVANELITQAYMNAFLIRSERSNHFAVRHTDTLNALTYLEVFDSSNLPAMPFEIEGLLPQCFYNNGTDTRPIFFDGSSWRYFSDNTIV
jgi:hypothetical protein